MGPYSVLDSLIHPAKMVMRGGLLQPPPAAHYAVVVRPIISRLGRSSFARAAKDQRATNIASANPDATIDPMMSSASTTP